MEELQQRLSGLRSDEEITLAARWLLNALAEIPEQRIWAAAGQEIEWTKISSPAIAELCDACNGWNPQTLRFQGVLAQGQL
eukprot:symbB.v1.2.009522.t1/scaffold606.1/size182035/12